MALASELTPARVAVENLLLDPNNPRLQGAAPTTDADGVPDAVATDAAVQAELVARLKRDIGLESLIEKIKANGFLPIDRIVVRPCQGVDSLYIVLEGNRRLASLRTIRSDAVAMAQMTDEQKETLDEVDVLVYEGDDPMIAWSIQGIRHIEGVKEWGPFQRASFLASLAERHDMTVPQIARLAGLRPNVSNRLVRAYQGMRQAQKDPDWGDTLGEADFAIFHEAVFAKNYSELWKWLEWDDAKAEFENTENLGTLLSLTKDEQDDGRPAIPRVNPDLRDHFQKLLASEDADRLLEELRSGETSLAKIAQRLSQEGFTDDLKDVQHAIARLKELEGAAELLPTPRIIETGQGPAVLEALNAIASAVQIQRDAIAGALEGMSQDE